MEEAIRRLILNSGYYLYIILSDGVLKELDANACEGNK
jgi:hypothetical protein